MIGRASKKRQRGQPRSEYWRWCLGWIRVEGTRRVLCIRMRAAAVLCALRFERRLQLTGGSGQRTREWVCGDGVGWVERARALHPHGVLLSS